jgi:ATP-dependent Clp protease, protease subunit
MDPFKKFKYNAVDDIKSYLPENIMSRWNPDIKAAADDDSTINIYDAIGEDFFGNGMTAKVVSSVLRKNKGQDVTVNINSPGGDFFEGLAIYNLLKEHEGKVTIRVIGMAASAASVIAMAGDDIKIAESAFFMIHNSWHIVMGNKHDMRERADTLEKFDESMVGIYSKISNESPQNIVEMMDDETWISGPDAIEMGFATGFIDTDEIDIDEKVESKYNSSLKTVDLALAKDGLPRSQRRAIIKDLTSKPGATVEEEVMPRADEKLCDALASFIETLNSGR